MHPKGQTTSSPCWLFHPLLSSSSSSSRQKTVKLEGSRVCGKSFNKKTRMMMVVVVVVVAPQMTESTDPTTATERLFGWSMVMAVNEWTNKRMNEEIKVKVRINKMNANISDPYCLAGWQNGKQFRKKFFHFSYLFLFESFSRMKKKKTEFCRKKCDNKKIWQINFQCPYFFSLQPSIHFLWSSKKRKKRKNEWKSLTNWRAVWLGKGKKWFWHWASVLAKPVQINPVLNIHIQITIFPPGYLLLFLSSSSKHTLIKH